MLCIPSSIAAPPIGFLTLRFVSCDTLEVEANSNTPNLSKSTKPFRLQEQKYMQTYIGTYNQKTQNSSCLELKEKSAYCSGLICSNELNYECPVCFRHVFSLQYKQSQLKVGSVRLDRKLWSTRQRKTLDAHNSF